MTPREETAPVEHCHIVRIGPKASSYKARNLLVRDEQEEEEDRPSKRQKAVPTRIGPKVSSAAYKGSRTRVLGQQAVSVSSMSMPKASYKSYRAITFVRDTQDEEEERPRRKMRIGPKVSSAAYRAICGVRNEEGDRHKRQKMSQELISRKQIVEQILGRRAATEAYRARNPPEPVKRRRGRPRLSSPRAIAKAQVKVEELQDDIPVVAQPRATNGRFEKKDKSRRKSRECSGVSSTVAKSDDDNDLGQNTRTSRRKRAIDTVEDLEAPPKKKSASERNPGAEVEGPVQKVIPRPASGFRGGRLFSNPNPLQFALYAWAGPLILDESSSDDEKQPETPEDGLSLAADIAPPEDLSPSMFLPSILPRAPLTYKPSPFVFAKNRWNATLNQVADNRRASTNSTLSEDKPWSNPRASASSEDEVILFRLLQNILH